MLVCGLSDYANSIADKQQAASHTTHEENRLVLGGQMKYITLQVEVDQSTGVGVILGPDSIKAPGIIH